MSGSTRRCATCSPPNCSPTCSIAGADTGNLVIQVRENPVINRIVLEGNRRIKDDKITPEIRLAPRQIFTRSRARADVARIIELYRRQGRYAASVEPQIVQLDQNRVDVVFEINEGPQVARPPDQHHRQRAVRRRPPDLAKWRPASTSGATSSARATPTIPTGSPSTSRSSGNST